MHTRFWILPALAAAVVSSACNLVFDITPGQPTGGAAGSAGSGGSGGDSTTESTGGTGATGGSGGMTMMDGSGGSGGGSGGSGGSGGGPSCTPGSASCDGAVLHACDGAGNPLADVTCDVPAACDAAAGKCIDAASLGRISVGAGRACAIEDNRRVRCWGVFGGGAILVDPPALTATAHQVPNAAEIRQISVGGGQVCGLQDDGTVTCWGVSEAGDTGQVSEGLQVPLTVPGLDGVVEVSTGYRCSCARLSDGTVKCWGRGDSGCFGKVPAVDVPTPTPTLVPGVTGAVQLRMGTYDVPTCVRQASQKVVCWMDKIPPTTIADVDDATDIAVGTGHVFINSKSKGLLWTARTDLGNDFRKPVAYVDGKVGLMGAGASYCGVDETGTLACSSYFSGLQPSIPVPVPGPPPGVIAELSVGFGNSYGHLLQCLRLAGQPISTAVYCWGDDGGGALGAGAPDYLPSPVTVPGVSGAKSLAAGEASTNVILGDGTVLLWGTALGLWDLAPSPQAVAFLGSDNAAVRTNDADRSAYVLKTSGALQFFQDEVPVPGTRLQASGFSDFLEVTGRNRWDMALRANGTLLAYAEDDMSNVAGIFGDGTLVCTANELQSVPALSNVIAMAPYGSDYDPASGHACAITGPSGALWCWGQNDFGQVGNGVDGPDPVATPVQVTFPGNPAVVSAATGYRFACAVVASGKVYCWGANYNGELGVSAPNFSPTPIEVPGIANAVSVSTREEHVCALLTDKTVKCWGLNESGQLGNGKIEPKSLPAPVNSLSDVVEISAGASHTCARTGDGKIHCWGSSYYGQIGTGITGDFPSPLAVQGL